MSYYVEMHKQATIAKVAVAGLVASAIALLVSVLHLVNPGHHGLENMSWIVGFTALSGCGVVICAKIVESALAKAEFVRMTGGLFVGKSAA